MDIAFQPDQTPPPALTDSAAWELVFSEAYLKTHVRRLRRCRQRWNARTVVNVLLLAVMVGLNVLVYIAPSNELSARVVMPVLLVVLLIVQWTQPLLASRRWRKSPLLYKRVRFAIGPAGVHIVDDLSEGRTQWAAFTRARRFADGWLLFLGGTLTNWLPDACLVLGDAGEADGIIRTHIADCRNR